MRVFVGTLHTIEDDFDACCQAINAQEGVQITHKIISGLRERDAHNALWSAWLAAKHDHDIFVKIDADTVLARPTTLSTICGLFRENPRVTGLQAPLHDYMTRGLINGMNAFSTKVIFNVSNDELFCDRVDTGHDIVLRRDQLPDSLIPAGDHCHHANEKQAFHYGLHRELKGQVSTLNAVRTAWLEERDRIRTFALLGRESARSFAGHKKFNYDDEEFKAEFESVAGRYDELAKKL